MIDLNRSKRNASDTLPHSIEAEKKVLGAMIRDKAQIGRVYDLFEGLDFPPFYQPSHQVVYEVLVDLAVKQRVRHIDLMILANALEMRGLMNEAGGAFYLAELASSVATSVNAVHHAQIVLDKAVRRKVIRESGITSEAAQTDELEALVDRVNRMWKDILPGHALGGLLHVSETIPGLLESIQDKLSQARSGRRVYKATRTGYTDLDNFTGGMDNHELVILAARPSLGKTSLAVGITYNVARTQGPVFFFSIETPADRLLESMICGAASFSLEEMRAGRINKTDVERLLQYTDEINRLPIYIDDTARSIDQIITRAEVAAERFGKPRLIVIDYLQLISAPYLQKNNIYERVTEVSRRCQGIPKIMGCPLLLLAQLNREVEKDNRDPRMSDLRESGSIEQDAFQIWFITLPEGISKEEEGSRKIVVAKNKDGRTGNLDLFFRPQYRWFSLVEKLLDEQPFHNIPPDAEPAF